MALRGSGPHSEDMALAPVLDLVARRTRGDDAIARVAAAPVRHVPVELLASLFCVPVEDVIGEDERHALRAVRGC